MDFKLSHRLLEKLCKDTLSGQELVKVLATSVLTVDETAGWVNDLASDGSLRLLVGSLAVDDKEIKASKYERYSKAFYSFDSKIALLLKIASTQNGARMLIHARIVDVLSKLECVEMYPFVVNQNEVCAKLFQNVIRLMNTIASSTLQRDYEHLSQFIGVRSSEFYDLLRLSHSFDQSEEVKSIITLVTSLLSRLILHANGQLQRLLIGSLNRHVEVNSKNDCLVITNILLACVKMSRNKAGLAIFAPSWERLDSSVALGQPTLGSLVYIVDSCLDKPSAESHLFISVIESSLYLIWHHLNLNYNVTEVTDENFGDIQRLKHKAADVMSDAFFAKLQSSIQENPYVDALIRRIKRIVHLSTDTTTSSSYF
ncbi:Nuclear pore complex protein [Halotydeus destructor]|nr:Nuclear pore complex protein [Halotydeus destructor]